MRAILVLSLTLLTLTVFATTATAAHHACVTIGGAEFACAYPDEPSFLVCVDVEGRTVACVTDPCGTTMCF